MQPIIALASEALLHLTEQEGGPICILRAAIADFKSANLWTAHFSLCLRMILGLDSETRIAPRGP